MSTMRLTEHRYGKTGVRLAKVERDGDHHVFHDLTLTLWLEGDFSAAYLRGDNSTSLPTDTMRASCYAVAADLPLGETETYLEAVLRRLLSVVPAATSAHGEARIHSWERITVESGSHPHAFRSVVGDGTAAVVVRRGAAPTGVDPAEVDAAGVDAAEVSSGLVDLLVTKTTGSAYAGFLTDDMTVLAETDDRILSTSVDVGWRWGGGTPASYAGSRATARRVVETVFATHHSLAVQQTLYETGAALLGALPEATSVTLRMPNRHHVPVDLTPFGRANRNEVFVVLDRPFGVIEATVERL